MSTVYDPTKLVDEYLALRARGPRFEAELCHTKGIKPVLSLHQLGIEYYITFLLTVLDEILI